MSKALGVQWQIGAENGARLAYLHDLALVCSSVLKSDQVWSYVALRHLLPNLDTGYSGAFLLSQ